MDRQQLRHIILGSLPQQSPDNRLINARRTVTDAESALNDINDILESFDRETIYKTGSYEDGGRFWRKCETRQTEKCYIATIGRDRTRRFRREDVEADNIRTPWYEGYHLGRFIHQELFDEQLNRQETFERSSEELRILENQFTEGRPLIGSLEAGIEDQLDRLTEFLTPNEEKIDWKDGF